ncbi:MAG: hypothetical protein QOC69_4550 [Mycobacterium sp.]|nr:hypothetical protein [Mycobacterium sp.]
MRATDLRVGGCLRPRRFDNCRGWISAPVDVVTVQPAMVGCLQIQPIGTIGVYPDVQS